MDTASGAFAGSFVSVDGARLYYEVGGSGPPVVLIHSGITDSRSWDPQVSEFARRFRLVRYDLRGFGRSDVPRGAYSNVADLESLLDAIGMERAALVGVSLGGALALDFTLEHPRRVAALVLVASGFSGRTPSAQRTAEAKALNALFDSGDIDAAVDRELEIWLYGKGRRAQDVDPVVRAAVREMDRHVSVRFPSDIQATPIDRPAAGRLEEVKVPTLVIVGDLDLDDIQDAANQLADRIPGAKRATMRGVAHVPNMEQPAEFNRLVIDFLSSALSDRYPPGA